MDVIFISWSSYNELFKAFFMPFLFFVLGNSFLSFIISHFTKTKVNSFFTAERVSSLIKSLLYGFLAIGILFYRPNNILELDFPDQISITNAFILPISIYEALANLLVVFRMPH